MLLKIRRKFAKSFFTIAPHKNTNSEFDLIFESNPVSIVITAYTLATQASDRKVTISNDDTNKRVNN